MDILTNKKDIKEVINDDKEYEMLYLIDEVLHSEMLKYWTSLYDKEK